MKYRRFSLLLIACLSIGMLTCILLLLSGLNLPGTASAASQPLQGEAVLVLTKTAALDSGDCGVSDSIEIPAGWTVTYCYDITNKGDITLTQHSLVDSNLGLLFDGDLALIPGGTQRISVTAAISSTIVNTATWTAESIEPAAVITAVDVASVAVVPAALIDVSPQSLNTILGPDQTASLSLTIENQGDDLLQWLLFSETGFGSRPSPESQFDEQQTPESKSRQVVASPAECQKYKNYTGPEPEGYAEHCLDQSEIGQRKSVSNLRGPTDIAYAQDVGFISDRVFWHYLNDFPGQVTIGTQPDFIFGYDFDVTGRILYGLNYSTSQLGVLDLDSGAFAPIGYSIPLSNSEDLTGLTIHPVTGKAYVCTSDGAMGRLYSVDLNTGALTFIGGDSEIPFLIDISINPDGVMYGHDIQSDSIYTIDVDTGEATLVGETGVDANFAQGMDFDNYDGTLYAWIYEGGGLNQYGTIDLETGWFTMLAIDDPTGEFVGATQTPLFDSCRRGESVPWITSSNVGGAVDPSSSQVISITIDSTNLSAGSYESVVCIESNDFFNRVIRVPVSLEIES
ncbi:MAG: DUF6923 family protein, partial [Candidatus Promineifilaceae bacterium]